MNCKKNGNKQQYFSQLNTSVDHKAEDVINKYLFEPTELMKEESERISHDIKKVISIENVLSKYGQDIKEINKRRRCIRCGINYTDKDNFQLACRMHASELDDYTRTYPCCGKTPYPGYINSDIYTPKGCCEVDHCTRAIMYNESDNTEIPICLVDSGIIKLAKDNINIVETVINKKDYTDSYYIVRRYKPQKNILLY